MSSLSPDPLYAGPRQAGQRPNGVIARPNGSPANDGETIQSRAAKFEDEKRRIIESCFSKRDNDGSQIESYITHVKVLEDALYTASPPPPNSDPSNKKSRVILVAVRKSGRVRLHKARENPSGSFSIGKTWNLDDLTAIQIYDAFMPANSQEQPFKQWAGPTGFVVTLGKPYFWQAPTAKEKEFFIGSLIKIYRKYTGGKLPELAGFTPQELEQMHLPVRSSPSVQSASASPQPQANIPPARLPFASGERPQSPYTPMPGSRDFSPNLGPEGSPAALRPQTGDGQSTPVRDEYRSPNRNAARQIDGEAAQGHGAFSRQRSPSTEQPSPARRLWHDGTLMPGPSPVTGPPHPLSEQSSLSSLQPEPVSIYERPLGRVNGSTPAVSQRDLVPPRLAVALSEDSLRQRSETGTSMSSRPSTAASEQRMPDAKLDRPPPLLAGALADRKRHFDPRPGTSSDQKSIHSEASSKFVTPLGTPNTAKVEPVAASREEPRVPLPSADYFTNKNAPAETNSEYPALRATEKSTVQTPNAIAAAVALPESPAVVSEPEEMAGETSTGEAHRPGLGPMVKKKSAKEIANTFRKAALAASAFQPRAGGAAARFKAQQEGGGPDGITGVVPAPLLRGMSTESARSQTPDIPTPTSDKDAPLGAGLSKMLPLVKLQRAATDDSVEAPQPLVVKKKQTTGKTTEKPRAQSPDKTRSRSPARRRRQRQEAEIEKYCSILGIDPRVLDGRGADFNDLLTEFGWDGTLPEDRRVEDFEAEVRREIGRAQATGWLGHIEQQENKIQELARSFEKAIEECEELDGLLTLYSHELDTLHEDIQYIEAQSQGLQVQTANQKLLQHELHELLKTLTISTSDLRGLQSASLGTPEGVQIVEQALATLYRAMITIDPEIRQNKIRQAEGHSGDKHGVAVYADTELGQMRAVRERKDDYRDTTMSFLRRFSQHMTSTFKGAEQRMSDDHSRTTSSSYSLDLKGHQSLRQDLWAYNALLLFVREVNSYEWQTLISSYEMNIKSTFQDQFRDNIATRKKTVRNIDGDDHEYLFTTQEKEIYETGLIATTRKMTVRGKPKALKSNTLKQVGGRREGGTEAWEVFDNIVQQQAKIISEEQNFVVHFFHLNSQSSLDFTEMVSRRPPQQRRLPDLGAKQSYDPDRNMAKIVGQLIDGIYSFWPMDLQSLVDWTIATDQVQTVGVLCSIEQCLGAYEETNQEYITRTLRALHDRLIGHFHKFVDEQIKAIEHTNIKAGSRKQGIIIFMRVFPLFSTAIENMIPADVPHHESLEIRFIVNDAYRKILKQMWTSLNVIAKQEATSGVAGAHSKDFDEKQKTNHHILQIQNMNYYIEEVDTHHNVVLDEWAEHASHDLFSHLTQYTDALIRSDFAAWIDAVESTEALMESKTDYSSIANNKAQKNKLKAVLKKYDASVMRHDVEKLKARIEKHFKDGDDGSVGVATKKGINDRALDECATRYSHAWDRMALIIDKVYDNRPSMKIDWRKEEIVGILKK